MRVCASVPQQLWPRCDNDYVQKAPEARARAPGTWLAADWSRPGRRRSQDTRHAHTAERGAGGGGRGGAREYTLLFSCRSAGFNIHQFTSLKFSRMVRTPVLRPDTWSLLIPPSLFISCIFSHLNILNYASGISTRVPRPDWWHSLKCQPLNGPPREKPIYPGRRASGCGRLHQKEDLPDWETLFPLVQMFVKMCF